MRLGAVRPEAALYNSGVLGRVPRRNAEKSMCDSRIGTRT